MAIFKFRDLCCPVGLVKMVQITETKEEDYDYEEYHHNLLTNSKAVPRRVFIPKHILEVHIEITAHTPLFKKFYFDTEEECEEAFKEIIYDLEDKGWGK